MDNFQSILGDAAGNALCSVLGTYGAAAPFLTLVGMRKPGVGTGALMATSQLAAVAATYGCNWDPGAPGPTTGGLSGCKKTDGYMTLYGNLDGNVGTGPGDPVLGVFVTEVTAVYVKDTLDANNLIRPGLFVEYLTTQDPGVTQRNLFTFVDVHPNAIFYTILQSGTCQENDIAPVATPPDPVPYTDVQTGCTLNVQLKGFGLAEADNVRPVFEITSGGGPAARVDSPIGGCNFAPLIYVGGSGGKPPGFGPVPDPIDDDGPEPWWAPIARGIAQGLAATAVQEALSALTEASYTGRSYAVNGVCELDPNGNPMQVTRSTNFPDGDFASAVLYRLDALSEMFQFNKDLRQPTCLPTSNQPGDPVTINFRSVQRTLTGNNQARKRFIYFDQVNSTLEATVAHWRDFTWNAGPVVVGCLDTPLGKPQVWAESLDEAKRVFAHAAAIAGVDLATARYELGTPKNPRYGFTGQMVVDRSANGILGITKRQGPSGLPDGLP